MTENRQQCWYFWQQTENGQFCKHCWMILTQIWVAFGWRVERKKNAREGRGKLTSTHSHSQKTKQSNTIEGALTDTNKHTHMLRVIVLETGSISNKQQTCVFFVKWMPKSRKRWKLFFFDYTKKTVEMLPLFRFLNKVSN